MILHMNTYLHKYLNIYIFTLYIYIYFIQLSVSWGSLCDDPPSSETPWTNHNTVALGGLRGASS